MLGFFPLGAYELETPALIEGSTGNAYILGGVVLADRALAGGKPSSTAAELAAAIAAVFSATAGNLHRDVALEANPTSLTTMGSATMRLASTAMRADAAAVLSASALLNMSHVNMASGMAVHVAAGEVYTVQLPRALSAALSSTIAASSIYTLPLPRALSAALSSELVASNPAMFRAPTLRSEPGMDFAMGQANLRRSVLFAADAALDFSVAAHMRTQSTLINAAAGGSFAGAVLKINLERQLSSDISVGVDFSGTLGVPATLFAAAAVAIDATADAVILPHVFPPPAASFEVVWLEDFYRVGTYAVRYDALVGLGEQNVSGHSLNALSTSVQAIDTPTEVVVDAHRLGIVTVPVEEEVVDERA